MVSVESEENSDTGVEITFRKHVERPFSYAKQDVSMEEVLTFDGDQVVPYDKFARKLERTIRDNRNIKHALRMF